MGKKKDSPKFPHHSRMSDQVKYFRNVKEGRRAVMLLLKSGNLQLCELVEWYSDRRQNQIGDQECWWAK